MAEYKLSYTASEIDEKLGMVDSMVKSVNGQTPDENGNVVVEGGAVTDEQLTKVVNNYFAENPVVCGVGISKIVKCTQAEYDALETKDETVLYIVADGASEEGPEDDMIPYLHITAPCEIETGIIPTAETAIEVIFYDTSLSNNSGFFGCPQYCINGQGAPWIGADIGNQTVSVNVNNFSSTGVKNTYRLDKTGLYINGTIAKEFSATPTDPEHYDINLHLFMKYPHKWYDSFASSCWLDDAKFYGAKIWQAGEIVRDIIPAEDSSGVACVYDKVTGTYLYNDNTGTLTYGKEVDE